jgi:hypothetical protein
MAGELFSHPLVLLLIGAGVSSYLIPWLTNKWQDHKKEIEIKIDLISKMSDIIALASGHAYVCRQNQENRENFHKDILDWLVKANNSRSQLRVYFPDATILGASETKISEYWNTYLSLLSVFWNFTYQTCDKTFNFESGYKGIEGDIKFLQEYFGKTSSEIDWKAFCSRENERQWGSLMREILSKGDELIRAVIVSRPRIFKEKPAILNRIKGRR